MSEIRYNPISDLGKMKETLVALLSDNENINRLTQHCVNTPYMKGSIAENESGIFIDTHLIKVSNQRIKEVGVEVYIVCHKDALSLSAADKEYFSNMDVHGNRADCIVQMVHSAILEAQNMEELKKKYTIGEMNLIEAEPIKQYMPEDDYCGKQMSFTCQSFYQRKSK